MLSHKPTLLLPALGLLAGVSLTACGGSSSSSDNGTVSAPSSSASTNTGASSSTSTGDPASLVPAEIKKAGVIRAATDGTYPPNEFLAPDGKTLVGFDIELANAVAAKLGVKIEFANAKFDSIITGITAGRYDLAFSSFTDNKDRQQKVDFVDYFTAGTSILVKKGNPEHISKLEDLCGKKIALESGTVQVKIAQGAHCTAGKKIDITQLPDDATARLQVSSGRAVADMNDFPVAAYNAKTTGNGNTFEVVGTQYETAPYGVAISKSLPGLRDAVAAALKALVSDGSYDRILAKWNITQGSRKDISINAGT
ncbi:MAG: ABC transporter substrate-binding protein [Mycobacteriales bacterium]